MTSRKKEIIALQTEIETREDWDNVVNKPGLTVVDVYQDWAGPCSSMETILRKLKVDTGDDMLNFAIAKANTIDLLKTYRGKCEPCFLFFASGVLVNAMHGINAPLFAKTVMTELKHEHDALEGNVERSPIVDRGFSYEKEFITDEEETEKENAEAVKHEVDFSKSIGQLRHEVTLAIIKPDIVKSGRANEIFEAMQNAGIEILKQEERTLTEDEARVFYEHLQNEDYFDSLVHYMSSGPSIIMAITKADSEEGVITEWRKMIGPFDVSLAKEEAPESLRAKYGTNKQENALHGSDSPTKASKELAFLFPDFDYSQFAKSKRIQRTLALIRPDGLRERRDEILKKIEEAGFEIALQKEIVISREEALEFYKEHKEEPYFEELITSMTNGPLLALGLAREDAVTKWKEWLGPKDLDQALYEAPDSLRATYAVEGINVNQLHGSDSVQEAKLELEYFFPVEKTLACIKPDASQSTREEIIAKIKEAGFHIASKKETTLTREIAEHFYVEHQGKEFFEGLVDHMCSELGLRPPPPPIPIESTDRFPLINTSNVVASPWGGQRINVQKATLVWYQYEYKSSGPTLFMVLTRENAIQGWRGLIGPADPVEAKEQAPDSLRALYGEDIVKNAVHGSTDPNIAANKIRELFEEDIEQSGKVTKQGKNKGAEKLITIDETKTGIISDTGKTSPESVPYAETLSANDTDETSGKKSVRINVDSKNRSGKNSPTPGARPASKTTKDSPEPTPRSGSRGGKATPEPKPASKAGKISPETTPQPKRKAGKGSPESTSRPGSRAGTDTPESMSQPISKIGKPSPESAQHSARKAGKVSPESMARPTSKSDKATPELTPHPTSKIGKSSPESAERPASKVGNTSPDQVPGPKSTAGKRRPEATPNPENKSEKSGSSPASKIGKTTQETSRANKTTQKTSLKR